MAFSTSAAYEGAQTRRQNTPTHKETESKNSEWDFTPGQTHNCEQVNSEWSLSGVSWVSSKKQFSLCLCLEYATLLSLSCMTTR